MDMLASYGQIKKLKIKILILYDFSLIVSL